ELETKAYCPMASPPTSIHEGIFISTQTRRPFISEPAVSKCISEPKMPESQENASRVWTGVERHEAGRRALVRRGVAARDDAQRLVRVAAHVDEVALDGFSVGEVDGFLHHVPVQTGELDGLVDRLRWRRPDGPHPASRTTAIRRRD